MAIYKTKELMLTIDSKELDIFLKQVIKDNLPIEFLNPSDLGEEWAFFEYIQPNIESETNDLNLLSELFKFYPIKGFWSLFEDNRILFTMNELKHSINNRKDLMYIVSKLLYLNERKKKLIDITKRNAKESNFEVENNALKKEIESVYKELDIDDESIKDVIIPEFKRLYSAIEIEKKVKELPRNIFKTTKNSEAYFCFIAFPESKEYSINKVLIENNIACKKINWNKDLVVWENKNFEPFKQISESLGVIDQNEFDPTVVITFFFAFFFALAINDALYGLIISVFTGYILYFKKIKPNLKNIFGLLFISGLFSLVVGAFTGSWAGNLFEKTPINIILSKFQLIKQIPTDSDKSEHLPIINELLNKNLNGTSPVVALLVFAVFIGIIHIFTALIIKAINAYKVKEYDHFITEIAWISFLICSILYFSPIFIFIKFIFFILGIVSLGLVFVFNSGKGIIGKIMKGLIQLYELVAFLADILSYTRLIAIGLTGAIIADVINLLAHLVYDANPSLLGSVLFVVVLLIGHSFNLIVGLFGAYINPLRLHYVEFLPKFYKGKARQLNVIDTNLTYGIIKI